MHLIFKAYTTDFSTGNIYFVRTVLLYALLDMALTKCVYVLVLYLTPPCYSVEIKMGVLLPEDTNFAWSIPFVLPAMQVAVEQVNDLLPNHRIQLYLKDSNCSTTNAPLSAVELYTRENVHVFLGPVCDYALAPVARYSPHWNIPVITAGGFAHDFDDKTEYKLLTRVLGTYSSAAKAFIDITKAFDWSNFGIIYQDHRHSNKGKPNCHLLSTALYMKIREVYFGQPVWYRKYEEGSSQMYLENLLRTASMNARIFALCGSSNDVRDIMIKAHDLNFDNGEYVFIYMDLIGSQNDQTRPWYRENDTEERNQKARKAYEALMIISQRKPHSQEYKRFNAEIKRRARLSYQNISLEDDVNPYAAAFHDAIMLYSLAANETLATGGTLRNGTEVTARMWNKTFQGISGEVAVDSNGDRKLDYSVLNMNPNTDVFEELLTYVQRTKEVEIIPGKQISWAGDSNSPPGDDTKCGFDGSKCHGTADAETTEVAETTDDAETTETTTTQPERTQVHDLLEDLQKTMTKITEAVNNHETNLAELTKFLQSQEHDSSVRGRQCPVASKFSDEQNVGTMNTIGTAFVLYLVYLFMALYKIII